MYNTNYYNRLQYPTQNYQMQQPYQNYNIMPQQQYMQPQMPVQQQMQPADVPITDIRFLTADQIKGFIPPLGSRVMLIDKDNKLTYIETTDNMGNFTKEIYSFKQMKENEVIAPQNVDTTMFVTTQELDTLKNEINDLKKQIKTGQITEEQV